MVSVLPNAPREPAKPAAQERLDSWKEIAAYLKRQVRTVQRWETHEGLPVHRHHHERRGSVYAYKSELDGWWRNSHERLGHGTPIQKGAWLPKLTVRRSLGAVVVFVFVVGGGVWFGLQGLHRRAPPLRVMPLTHLPGVTFSPSFSPDGGEIAFGWARKYGEGGDLYVQHLADGSLKRLTNQGVGTVRPSWSPDGRTMALFRISSKACLLSILSVNGGREEVLASLPGDTPDMTLSVAWTRDSKALLFPQRRSQSDSYHIVMRSLEDGSERPLTFPPADFNDLTPSVSPDGRTVAFLRARRYLSGAIYVQRLSSGEPQLLSEDLEVDSGLAWMSKGLSLLVFKNNGADEGLWRIPFHGGRPLKLFPTMETSAQPAVSPQGDRMAFVNATADENVWAWDLFGGKPPEVRIASSRLEEFAQFSPDGSKIVFQSNRSGQWELWVADSLGRNPIQLTYSRDDSPFFPRWSPNGKQIVFDSRKEKNSCVYIMDVQGGAFRRIDTGPGRAEVPSFSGDGRWLYFASDADDGWQIWKIPAKGGRAVRLTTGGGYSPLEAPDGSIFYAKGIDSPGIWRVSGSGGDETPVIDAPPGGYWASWVVAKGGIYYVNPAASGGPAIEFFNFSTRRAHSVLHLEKPPAPSAQGLAVSPDGRELLWAQYDWVQADVMTVVGDFR